MPLGSHGEDVAAVFGPSGVNQPGDFTSYFRRMWGEVILGKTEAVGYLPPEWVEGEQAQMLNLNTTGGTAYQVVAGSGVTVTQFAGGEADVDVVGAYGWEGGRGERCEFWREIADRIPI